MGNLNNPKTARKDKFCSELQVHVGCHVFLSQKKYSDKTEKKIIHGYFQTCVLQSNGFSVLKPQINFQMDTNDEDSRKQHLDRWRIRLQNIWSEQPLPSISNTEFNEQNILRSDSKYRNMNHAPSIGIHLGKNILSHL